MIPTKHVARLGAFIPSLGIAICVGLTSAGCGKAPAAAAPATADTSTKAAAETPAAPSPDAPAVVPASSTSSPASSAATVGPGSTSRPPTPFTYDMAPPTDSKEAFINWMVANRAENPKFLGERWDRYQAMLANGDLLNDQTKHAFLLTPREEFVRKISLPHSYDHAFLDIGFGVTISGPHAVGRMTSVLDIKKGEKVLEIGSGSGYQSAMLGHLTDKVWTIEIIKPLADRTRGVYDGLIARGYSEYAEVHTKQADGYYGWEEAAPFDKIVVTCGIDHIPPSLLQQLKVGGVMVIPVGPPGLQHVLKVTKEAGPDGQAKITRSDIYNGKVVPFVPFTKLEGNAIVGSHNK
jgi:protein-L-isoaspartate(D-aspartate) O-methyltransferase